MLYTIACSKPEPLGNFIAFCHQICDRHDAVAKLLEEK